MWIQREREREREEGGGVFGIQRNAPIYKKSNNNRIDIFVQYIMHQPYLFT